MTPEEKIAHLEGQITELRTENAEKRVKNRDLKTAHDKLVTDLADRDRRIADFEGKQGKPSELQATIDRLTKENRSIKHKSAFKEVAAAEGVDPKAIDDAWEVLRLNADSDEPDSEAIREAVTAARESKPYLFRPAETLNSAPPANRPPLGGDRGGKAGAGAKFTLTGEMRRDPEFMARNDALIRQHDAAGTLVRTD